MIVDLSLLDTTPGFNCYIQNIGDSIMPFLMMFISFKNCDGHGLNVVIVFVLNKYRYI